MNYSSLIVFRALVQQRSSKSASFMCYNPTLQTVHSFSFTSGKTEIFKTVILFALLVNIQSDLLQECLLKRKTCFMRGLTYNFVFH
jgi:hypothetical protein